jgi:hypothetical protein
MAKMVRVNKIYGHGNAIPVSKARFYGHYVLRSEDDPYIPGTTIRRLRLASIGEHSKVCFEDEINALVEGLRAMRDAVIAEQAERGKRKAKKRRAAEALARGAA